MEYVISENIRVLTRRFSSKFESQMCRCYLKNSFSFIFGPEACTILEIYRPPLLPRTRRGGPRPHIPAPSRGRCTPSSSSSGVSASRSSFTLLGLQPPPAAALLVPSCEQYTCGAASAKHQSRACLCGAGSAEGARGTATARRKACPPGAWTSWSQTRVKRVGISEP